MGPEKLDNNVYYIRGLYDLADLPITSATAVAAPAFTILMSSPPLSA